MTVEYIEYNGQSYPVRTVYLMNVTHKGQCENWRFADIELWMAIKDDCENNVPEAIEIDDYISLYCDSGFIASEPSDKKIISYVKSHAK